MTSTFHKIALLILLVAACNSRLAAQSDIVPLPAPQLQLSEAEKNFDQAVQTFEKYLFDSGAFSVNVTSKWTYRGAGEKTEGTNLFFVAVKKGGMYRIEAGSAAKGKAQYVCASDKQYVVRYHQSAKYFSRTPASVTHDDLQHDTLTLQTLSGSGVELLIRPQIRAQLIAQIDKVEFVGDETLDGQAVAHSRLTLDDGKLLDVWFTKQTKPLLLQLATTERIPVSVKQTIELITTSKFAWKVGGPLPDSTFSVTVPPDTRQVDDLLAALRDGDMRQVLGKPAPLLELANLNGQPVRLADYRGKQVVVLIFWASWCAPSTNSMDTLNTFVTEAESNGAVVLAINLGETPAQVKATIKEFQYRGTVLLDPDTKSLDAYRFGELPMTVMIGKDGTVQSFQSGSTATARERIRLDTATLLQGKSLISAGVR